MSYCASDVFETVESAINQIVDDPRTRKSRAADIAASVLARLPGLNRKWLDRFIEKMLAAKHVCHFSAAEEAQVLETHGILTDLPYPEHIAYFQQWPDEASKQALKRFVYAFFLELEGQVIASHLIDGPQTTLSAIVVHLGREGYVEAVMHQLEKNGHTHGVVTIKPPFPDPEGAYTCTAYVGEVLDYFWLDAAHMLGLPDEARTVLDP
jgi:hypothetical protein